MEFMVGLFNSGGPVMWPLLMSSLLSVTITIERICYWVRERNAGNEKLISSALDFAEAGDYEAAVNVSAGGRNYLARVINEGIKHRDHGISDVMQMAASREVEKMKSGLSILDTIITMAPLLGILGTVMGIIDSFNLLGATGIEDPKAVTAGIAQALITTATGLSIALITLIPYNYFISRVQSGSKLLETVGTELEIIYRKSTARHSE